jgi:hypothetical protein
MHTHARTIATHEMYEGHARRARGAHEDTSSYEANSQGETYVRDKRVLTP